MSNHTAAYIIRNNTTSRHRCRESHFAGIRGAPLARYREVRRNTHEKELIIKIMPTPLKGSDVVHTLNANCSSSSSSSSSSRPLGLVNKTFLNPIPLVMDSGEDCLSQGQYSPLNTRFTDTYLSLLHTLQLQFNTVERG